MAKKRASTFQGTFISTNGTVLLHTRYRDFNPTPTVDTIDASCGTASGKQYVLGLDDFTAEFKYVRDDGSGTADDRILYNGAYGTLTFGPDGTATGKPKFQCAGWVLNPTSPMNYAALAERSVTFQKDGNWISNFEVSADVF